VVQAAAAGSEEARAAARVVRHAGIPWSSMDSRKAMAAAYNSAQQTSAARPSPTLRPAAAVCQHEAVGMSDARPAHAACVSSAHHGSIAAAGVTSPWLLAVLQAAATGVRPTQAVTAAALQAATVAAVAAPTMPAVGCSSCEHIGGSLQSVAKLCFLGCPSTAHSNLQQDEVPYWVHAL
jgi:hypothetical protein